ncbi:MAG TPA: hypothetical protein VGL38_08865 [bacterium]|jgi:hypothetical protein
MPESRFSLDLGKGTFEVTGSEEFIERHLPDLKDLASKVIEVMKQNPQTSGAPAPAMGINARQQLRYSDDLSSAPSELLVDELKAFLDALELRESEIEYTTAIVYYLREKLGRDTVEFDDIEECYRLVGRPVPRIDKSVHNAAYRYKFLNRDKDGNVAITRVGRNFIEHPETARGAKPSKGTKSDDNGDTRKKSSSSAPSPKVKGDLDLFGTAGHIPFKGFCESKSINEKSSNADKFAVSAYYLTQQIGQPTFDENDIYTCFDHMRWAPPSYIRNNLINHKNQFGYYSMEEGRFAVTLKLKIRVERELGERTPGNLDLLK